MQKTLESPLVCKEINQSILKEIKAKYSLEVLIQKASLIAQWVKNLPTMQETQFQFLDQEDPLEKEMTIHSSIIAWKIPWTEVSGGLQSIGSQESDTT